MGCKDLMLNAGRVLNAMVLMLWSQRVQFQSIQSFLLERSKFPRKPEITGVGRVSILLTVISTLPAKGDMRSCAQGESFATKVQSRILYKFQSQMCMQNVQVYFGMLVTIGVVIEMSMPIITRLRIIFFYFYLNIPIPYARKIFKIFPYFSH